MGFDQYQMGFEQYMYCAVELWGAFFCVVAALVVFITRHDDKPKADRLIALMMCCAAQLCSDALTRLFSQRVELTGNDAERIARFLTNFFAYGTLALVVRYVSYLIERRCDRDLSVWVASEYGIAVVGLVCIVVNEQQPFLYRYDAIHQFVKMDYYWMLGILGMLGLSLALGVVIRFLDELQFFERVAMVCLLLLPYVAVVLQLFVAGPSFVSLSITISTMALFFAREVDYAQRAVEMERQLNDLRLKVLGRQIKPHFMFNSLSLIRYMSRRQPQEVPRAIDEFSSFLRACTDLFDHDSCISASDEFDLVRHYAYLQERRFEGELRVEYDLRDTGFELPAFSVQTSVENAITHGIRGRATVRDGLVVVRSYQDGGVHVVEVEDNGVGFNTSEFVVGEMGHTGIFSTRKRLELMCGGTYGVRSEPGKGTVATIRVPAHAGLVE